MSDEETNNDDFPDFKGKPDVEEDGFTTSEIGISIGFILLIAGFILGLIRLMALNGDTNQADFNKNLESYLLVTSILELVACSHEILSTLCQANFTNIKYN